MSADSSLRFHLPFTNKGAKDARRNFVTYVLLGDWNSEPAELKEAGAGFEALPGAARCRRPPAARATTMFCSTATRSNTGAPRSKSSSLTKTANFARGVDGEDHAVVRTSCRGRVALQLKQLERRVTLRALQLGDLHHPDAERFAVLARSPVSRSVSARTPASPRASAASTAAAALGDPAHSCSSFSTLRPRVRKASLPASAIASSTVVQNVSDDAGAPYRAQASRASAGSLR